MYYIFFIVQECGLLPGDYRDSGRAGRAGRGERLTEGEKKELRQMRKRQRAEHRKKKILKLDDEGVSSKTQFLYHFVIERFHIA